MVQLNAARFYIVHQRGGEVKWLHSFIVRIAAHGCRNPSATPTNAPDQISTRKSAPNVAAPVAALAEPGLAVIPVRPVMVPEKSSIVRNSIQLFTQHKNEPKKAASNLSQRALFASRLLTVFFIFSKKDYTYVITEDNFKLANATYNISDMIQ